MNINIISQNIANNPSDFTAEHIKQLFEDYGKFVLSDHAFRKNRIKAQYMKEQRLKKRNERQAEKERVRQRAKEVIQKYGLNEKTKRHEIKNKRHFFIVYLAICTPLTRADISELFDVSTSIIQYIIGKNHKAKIEEVKELIEEMKCSQS